MVELEDFQNKSYTALYQSFKVEQSPLYELRISGYDTDYSSLQDSLSYHNNHAFSTKDRDNDAWGGNCATQYLGAWWYRSCLFSNLNGYNYNSNNISPTLAKGIIWRNEQNVAEQGYYFSWPKVEMKIRQTGC